MAQITLKSPAGKDAGTVELDDAVFGIQPNVPVMHQVVTAQLARRRSGTQSTKTRSEVSGGGAKPYRQKGTGNARQGSTRAPHYSGGGIALGPKPRTYGQRTPKKMIKLALRSALSDRAAESKVLVVDSWGFDAPKTKDAVAALSALGLDGRVLVVVDRDDAPTALSFRNLPEVQLIQPGELNAYDVLCNDWVVFTSANLPTADAAATEPTSPAAAVHAEDPAEGADDVPAVQTFADVVPADEGSASDESEEAERVSSDVDQQMDERFGEGSHVALEDDSQPEGFPIKGNANSMLYHVPGSAFYDRTIAEVWFASPEAAEAAGFELPPSQRDDDEDAGGEHGEAGPEGAAPSSAGDATGSAGGTSTEEDR